MVAAQKVVMGLVAKKNALLGVPKPAPVEVAEPEPVAAPMPEPVKFEPKPVPAAPTGIVDPEFDMLLPDTLQELPNNAPSAKSAGIFDNLMPEGLSPPASDS